MGAAESHTQTKHDFVIDAWQSLACESVGARELEEIQRAISERFGAGAVGSPASIARTLADEGANLRHTEVMACDASWREQNFRALNFPSALNFEGLAESLTSIQKLESMRIEFHREANHEGQRRLSEAVRNSREDCLLVAGSPIVGPEKQAEANEIAEWLAVWLKQPEIFADWIELRKCSVDFAERFGQNS